MLSGESGSHYQIDNGVSTHSCIHLSGQPNCECGQPLYGWEVGEGEVVTCCLYMEVFGTHHYHRVGRNNRGFEPDSPGLVIAQTHSWP